MKIPKVTVPIGESGEWKIERFVVDDAGSRWSFMTGRGRGVPPGEYTRLTCRGEVVMSDTPNEMRDHYQAVHRASGEVLIHGLGLGMVVNACLLKPEVTKVTCVEIDEHVISLVAKHYQAQYGNRLVVVHADALQWTPPKGVRYGVVWHDIWPTICADNLEAMKRLHRRYGRRCDWQGSWARELITA